VNAKGLGNLLEEIIWSR